MKKFSILKLVCMLLCSFSLFAACASSGGSNSGGSSEDPNDYGIIKDYNPYISPTKRHIIATEYLNCMNSFYSTKYFITESGEVYSDYDSSSHNRLNVFDKSNNKVTDEVKIASGECIDGSQNAILKSKEGKYYITNIENNTSVELTFYKDKATPYEASDEVKFGNVEVSGSYYASLKDGVIHYWETSEESKPIKVSGSNSFNQMYVSETSLFAITSDGTLYKLNDDATQMEEFTEIYHKNKTSSNYNISYPSTFTQSSNIKFKAIYSGANFLSTDNKLYQYKEYNGKVNKIATYNDSDRTYNDDLTLTEVFEKGTVYVESSGAITEGSHVLGKDSAGNYYDLYNNYYSLTVDQFTNTIVNSSDIILNYYYNSYNFHTFFKTSDGLEVRGINSYGLLGIGRDHEGIIGTTDDGEKKVLFPESDGSIDVKKMWMSGSYYYNPIFAYTDKGFYTWGKASTGADNLAVPTKVMAYKITGFPSGMGTVSGTHDCDLTLTATEASNINIKDTRGNLFITEDGRAFSKYYGNLNFNKDEWRYAYKCASEGVIANSFVQLDLGEGVVAKGFVDSERVMTNIGILNINSFYYNKWAETEGTIVE